MNIKMEIEWYIYNKKYSEKNFKIKINQICLKKDLFVVNEIKQSTKYWYQNNKLHREDGPAIEYPNGDKAWYQNGKRHRVGGPAILYSNGYKQWFIMGKEYFKKEYNLKMSICIEKNLFTI